MLPKKARRHPTSFTDAKDRADAVKRVQASKTEGNALEAQEAFDCAKLPPGQEVISIPITFTMKVNQEGQVEEYQCQLLGGNLKKCSGKLKKSLQ